MFSTRPVTTCEEGITRLLEVSRRPVSGWTLQDDSLILPDGRRVPLMKWRTHYKMKAFRSFSAGDAIRFGAAHAAALSGPSVFRLQYAGRTGESLEKILFRELDLSEWLTGAKTRTIFAMRNRGVLHVTTCLDTGTVCILELSAALPPDADPVYKHELTTESGFVSDRAVDTQITPHGMYLMNDDGVEAFDEVDTLTWGLNPDDAQTARAAYALLTGEADADEYIAAEKRLNRLCELAELSAQTENEVDAGEVNA